MSLFKVSDSVYPVIVVVVLGNKENKLLWIKLSSNFNHFFGLKKKLCQDVSHNGPHSSFMSFTA